MCDINKQVIRFLSSTPRFKLVVVTDKRMLVDLPMFDLGYHLSMFLKENDKLANKDLPFFIQEELTRLINQNIIHHPDFGDYICLSNIGILFERDLKVNVLQTLQRFSRNNLVILYWEGEIRGNKLFFLSENSKYIIDLSATNHIILL